ncbi:MAG: YihY/virulence factor BrkB family protein, partial [Phaeodactylibacter sp.]|nr:YihY/virulence factor BrkB family protein [Phaeodactylibacter sp.]
MKLPTVKALKKRFWSHPRVVSFLNWTKRRSLPGFFKVPIYDVVTFLISETQRFAVVTRANSTAFSFFLAIFPSIIVLLTLLPYLSSYLLTHIPGGEDFMSIMYREIKFIMPGNAGDMLFETIEDITTKP